ncbi:MAG: NADPH2:quinone reductase [Myxococcota bacterium]|jgi:NADPH2:quinone reductase
MIRAKAVHIRGAGGPEVLAIDDTQVREPGASELLIEVAAAGLNRADTLQRRGFYPAPPGVAADIPGLEYAGTVAAVGSAVRAFTVGDRVMGITAGAAMATHVVVHEREAIEVPDSLELRSAAAIPEAFLTAFDAVMIQAGLTMGERLLIHAVGSGVGTAAIQLAHGAGAVVHGTSRTAKKLERAAALGLDRGILVTDGTFADRTQPDVILDLIGGAYLEENLKAINSKGRIITIGLMGGASGKLSLGRLLAKRATLIGTVLRSRPLEEKATLVAAFRKSVMPGFISGQFKPIVDRVLPMSAIADAHTVLESNETYGKIVMVW